METRKLGSNFEISAIGLGCMGMTHGFGDASDQKEMIEVIRGAYQAYLPGKRHAWDQEYICRTLFYCIAQYIFCKQRHSLLL